MSETNLPPLAVEARSAWIRLRTLILLRWLAVLGQSTTVVFADAILGIRVPHAPCALVIGASAGVNFVAMTLAAENRRLSEREAVLTLLFDICQLGALLYLTGGLGNPFALLIMAPVTISAAVLTRRATVLLGIAAAFVTTLLARFYVPLTLTSGAVIEVPAVLAAGTWTALLIGTAFLAIFVRRVTDETFSMSQALAATQMALVREQQLSALGGVVAAAAHELGTPLATIKLVSTELVDELADHPELQEDARLVRAQADRCAEILRAMGPRASDDTLVRYAPFASVVGEAARPTPSAASASSSASRAPRSATDWSRSRWSRAAPRSSRGCETSCRTPSTSPAPPCGSTSTGRPQRCARSSATTARAIRRT